MNPPFLIFIEQALTWADLGAVLIGIGDHLLGAPGDWGLTSERSLVDRNGGAACFHRERAREGATLTEHCESGTGNPRDGYGYDGEITLEVGRHSVHASFGAYSPPGGHISIYLTGFTSAELEAVRAVVGGIVRLPKPDMWEAVTNIKAALKMGDEDAAVRWLEGVRDHGRWFWRSRFFQLKAQLLGSTPEHTLRRLKETPSDRDAWLEAEQSPPPGLPLAQIKQMVQRMCPVSLELFGFSRWRLLEGRGPTEGLVPQVGPSINGHWLGLTERPNFRPSHDISEQMLSLSERSVSPPSAHEHFSCPKYQGMLINHARWSGGSLHLWTEWQQCTVLPHHSQPHPLLFTEGVAERVYWSWIWAPSGEADGVLVLIEQQGAPDRQESIKEDTPLRVFAWLSGTAAFQKRAMTALSADGRQWTGLEG
jgi:hypothetical protein